MRRNVIYDIYAGQGRQGQESKLRSIIDAARLHGGRAETTCMAGPICVTYDIYARGVINAAHQISRASSMAGSVIYAGRRHLCAGTPSLRCMINAARLHVRTDNVTYGIYVGAVIYVSRCRQ